MKLLAMPVVKARSDRKRRMVESIIANSSVSDKIAERIIALESTKAVRAASARAMEITGHVIKAHEGWFVCEDKDGTLTRITSLIHRNWKS
jgi:hypothetical protein